MDGSLVSSNFSLVYYNEGTPSTKDKDPMIFPSGLPCWTHNSSIGSPSHMAEEASCATHVLYWISTQSVIHDHGSLHTSPYSCSTNQTSLCGPWLFLTNPVSISQLEYSAILVYQHLPQTPAPALVSVPQC